MAFCALSQSTTYIKTISASKCPYKPSASSIRPLPNITIKNGQCIFMTQQDTNFCILAVRCPQTVYCFKMGSKFFSFLEIRHSEQSSFHLHWNSDDLQNVCDGRGVLLKFVPPLFLKCYKLHCAVRAPQIRSHGQNLS